MGYDYSTIQLDLRSETPLFEQIADQLRADILLGELAVDEQLPAVRHLAQQLKINFNTVARAYRILDAERLILSRQGQGSFVTGGPGSLPEPDEPTAPLPLFERVIEQIKGLVKDAGFTLSEVTPYLCDAIIQPQHASRQKPGKKTMRVRKQTQDQYLAVLQSVNKKLRTERSVRSRTKDRRNQTRKAARAHMQNESSE